MGRIPGAFVVLSVPGIAGLFVTASGFEEPNGVLLLVSTILMLVAPVAVLVHLIATKELTRQEKRVWMRHLAGSRAPSAFVAYLTSRDRRATLRSKLFAPPQG